MGREVRITIDDDEVFERMKHRKRELDLSWEEVLHRGLRRTPDSGEFGSPGPSDAGQQGATFGYTPGPGQSAGSDRAPGDEFADHRDAVEKHHEALGRHHEDVSRRFDTAGEDYDDQWNRFADSVEAQVQNKVYNALRNTFGAAGIDVPEPPEPLDREMQDLSNAEDAVLTFDFLDDDPAYHIPLRVNLETSVAGLDVEVVAVRQGKSVRDMNQFDSEARLAVTKRLAKGEPAILRFDDGAEGYEVEPVIRWERDDSGRPTVTAVDIQAVRLNDDDE